MKGKEISSNRKSRNMKGQITVLNLIMVLITLFLYFAFIPVLSPMIDETSAYLTNNTSSQFASVTVVLLHMVPFLMLVCIVITAFNYAIPKREGHG